MKLLVVNIQDPSRTCYRNPKTIGSWFLGRRINNYPVFCVSSKGYIERINFSSSDVFDIQNTINKIFNCGGE